MTTDVRKIVRACEVCSKVKTVGRTIKSDLVPRKAIAPMHTISIDLMGPYTRSKKGRRYLITAMDQFSRWTEAYPVNNADFKKVAEVLEKEFFSRFGFPNIVLTDNGSHFTSKFWKTWCERLNITHHTTAVYSARQNPVERANGNIKTKLRSFLAANNKTHNCWDENISNILNNSTNSTTKFSPAEILFGRRLQCPNDWPDNSITNKVLDPESEGVKRINENISIVNKVREEAAKRSTKPVKNGRKLQVGQEVWIKSHLLSKASNQITASLGVKWLGPYTVVEHVGANVYWCKNLTNHRDVRKVDIKDIQIKT